MMRPDAGHPLSSHSGPDLGITSSLWPNTEHRFFDWKSFSISRNGNGAMDVGAQCFESSDWNPNRISAKPHADHTDPTFGQMLAQQTVHDHAVQCPGFILRVGAA